MVEYWLGASARQSGFVEVLSPLEDTEMKISRNASCGNWVSAVMKRLLIAFLALIISWVGSSNAIASEGSVETVPCVNDPVYHSNLQCYGVGDYNTANSTDGN